LASRALLLNGKSLEREKEARKEMYEAEGVVEMPGMETRAGEKKKE